MESSWRIKKGPSTIEKVSFRKKGENLSGGAEEKEKAHPGRKRLIQFMGKRKRSPKWEDVQARWRTLDKKEAP